MKKRVSQILPIVALMGTVGLFSSACIDEVDDFGDMDQLRPQRPACATCSIIQNGGGPGIQLGLHTDYNPDHITNVIVKISRSGVSETLDYGDTLAVPSDPDSIFVYDSELCTVGTTGLPPTDAYVEFEFTDASGVWTAGNYVPITGTCS